MRGFRIVSESIKSEGAEARFGPGEEPGGRITEHLDFLPRLEGTGSVIDWDFDRSMASADQLDEQFPVEVESVAFKVQAPQAVSAEDFVHGEGIVQLDAERDVDQLGEKPVCQIEQGRLQWLVGELSDRPPVWVMTRTEHEFLQASRDGRQENFVVGEIIFEIGVLNENDVSGSLC